LFFLFFLAFVANFDFLDGYNKKRFIKKYILLEGIELLILSAFVESSILRVYKYLGHLSLNLVFPDLVLMMTPK
jgi:hypothetical protein